MRALSKSKASVRNLCYPQIETERLLLRMFKQQDLNAAYLLFNDAEVQKHLSPQNKRTREQMKILLEKCRNY